MAKWKVEFDPMFLKQLDGMSEETRKEISNIIKMLSECDDPTKPKYGKAKKLTKAEMKKYKEDKDSLKFSL